MLLVKKFHGKKKKESFKRWKTLNLIFICTYTYYYFYLSLSPVLCRDNKTSNCKMWECELCFTESDKEWIDWIEHANLLIEFCFYPGPSSEFCDLSDHGGCPRGLIEVSYLNDGPLPKLMVNRFKKRKTCFLTCFSCLFRWFLASLLSCLDNYTFMWGVTPASESSSRDQYLKRPHKFGIS